MDLALKIIGTFFAVLGTTAAIYNLLTARSNVKDAARNAKLDATHELAKRTEQEVAHLKQRMDDCDARTEKRLDQIGSDVASMKKMFTDFIIDNLRQARN
ncbi:hypothetical protein [Hymenobacter sp. YC55]|uniref:hypothetical protein n=1 Tax=Hymenobacter sp. YC55 TaxID=3034019 RepID=UPI0023F962EA|nr:hypothetical protein [Hymenobacter sp. YC55]MDF7810508.1 hypothetical protein [Hymenobacter sp. YC55]